MTLPGEGALWERLAAGAAGAPWQAAAWEERGLTVEARDGALRVVEQWTHGWAALRVDLGGGRVGFAALPVGRATPPVEELLARARAAAGAQDPEPGADLQGDVGPAPGADLGLWDPAVREVDAADLLERARALERAARAADPRVDAVRRPTLEAAEVRREIRNHRGQVVAWQESAFSASVEVAASGEGGAETGWAADERRRLADLEPEAVGREAATRAAELLGARPAPPGVHHVVLDARVAAELLETLAPSLLGESHLKATSLLLNRLGERVVSAGLTVWDDGLRPGGPGTQPVDDEGTPRRRTRVISAGVLEALLYDRATAARAGARSTGNALGGPSAPPRPGVTNLYIEPGTGGGPEALMGELGRGLWVREVLGVHTVDPVSGDFSLGCSGLWFDGGVPVFPVCGAAASGNLLDLFGRVVGVGSDLRFQGAVGSPSLAVEGVDLAQ